MNIHITGLGIINTDKILILHDLVKFEDNTIPHASFFLMGEGFCSWSCSSQYGAMTYRDVIRIHETITKMMLGLQ